MELPFFPIKLYIKLLLDAKSVSTMLPTTRSSKLVYAIKAIFSKTIIVSPNHFFVKELKGITLKPILAIVFLTMFVEKMEIAFIFLRDAQKKLYFSMEGAFLS